ncbi:MAG: thioesterase family protein, partial [Pseudomonadota bacterium]
MYPFLRSIGVIVGARGRPLASPDEPSTIRTICWPWDADMFLELNNGRHLTLFDLGRFGHGARMGLFGVLRRRRWGLVVGGAFVQYRRRIRL